MICGCCTGFQTLLQSLIVISAPDSIRLVSGRWQKRRRMEFGSCGWKSGSDRAGWAGSPGSPYQPQPASGSAPGPGPLIVPQGVCLMQYNEPQHAPRWPGVVTSSSLLPPLCPQSELVTWEEVQLRSGWECYSCGEWISDRFPPMVWVDICCRWISSRLFLVYFCHTWCKNVSLVIINANMEAECYPVVPGHKHKWLKWLPPYRWVLWRLCFRGGMKMTGSGGGGWIFHLIKSRTLPWVSSCFFCTLLLTATPWKQHIHDKHHKIVKTHPLFTLELL